MFRGIVFGLWLFAFVIPASAMCGDLLAHKPRFIYARLLHKMFVADRRNSPTAITHCKANCNTTLSFLINLVDISNTYLQ
jgi:hypothetical protein